MTKRALPLLFAFALLPGCQNDKPAQPMDGGSAASTEAPKDGHFDSKSPVLDFATPTKRAAFLGRYLKLRSPVADAHFVLEYHANSGLLPGPSDLDLRAVMKVSPSDLPAWTEGATAARAEDLDANALMTNLLPADVTWSHAAAPHVYRRAGTLIATYDEGYVVEAIAVH